MKLKDKYKLRQSVYSPTGLVKTGTVVKIEDIFDVWRCMNNGYSLFK